MIAREVVHPGQTERHSARAAGQNPGLGLELVLSVDVGRGEGQRLRQRPPLRHARIHLVGAEGEQLCAHLLRALRHPLGQQDVGAEGVLRLLLAVLGVGEGRRVDDDVRVLLQNEAQHRVFVGSAQGVGREGAERKLPPPHIEDARAHKAACAGH